MLSISVCVRVIVRTRMIVPCSYMSCITYHCSGIRAAANKAGTFQTKFTVQLILNPIQSSRIILSLTKLHLKRLERVSL